LDQQVFMYMAEEVKVLELGLLLLGILATHLLE
jgi:hypothetical protein